MRSSVTFILLFVVLIVTLLISQCIEQCNRELLVEVMTEKDKKLYYQYRLRTGKKLPRTEEMMGAARKHERIKWRREREELGFIVKPNVVPEPKRPKRKQWPWESE